MPIEERHTLVVMRLADMVRVHPNMVTDVCHVCKHEVGIYPSGQNFMKNYDVDVICVICHPPTSTLTLAPGAENEPNESIWKK